MTLYTYDTVSLREYGYTLPSGRIYLTRLAAEADIERLYGRNGAQPFVHYSPDYSTWDALRDTHATTATPTERRIVRPATWQEREGFRFCEDGYREPLWHRENFWRGTAHLDHYAHISLEDPSMVAFTPDAAKGELDRQTKMKPGKYLTRFFPELGAKRIAYLAEWWKAGVKPPVELEGSFALATTGSEMIEVYGAEIDSCMQGADCVAVYAAGDLAIAHWIDGEGDTVARGICWPERGVYGRIYPRPDETGSAMVGGGLPPWRHRPGQYAILRDVRARVGPVGEVGGSTVEDR